MCVLGFFLGHCRSATLTLAFSLAQVSEFSFVLASRARRLDIIAREVRGARGGEVDGKEVNVGATEVPCSQAIPSSPSPLLPSLLILIPFPPSSPLPLSPLPPFSPHSSFLPHSPPLSPTLLSPHSSPPLLSIPSSFLTFTPLQVYLVILSVAALSLLLSPLLWRLFLVGVALRQSTFRLSMLSLPRPIMASLSRLLRRHDITSQ